MTTEQLREAAQRLKGDGSAYSGPLSVQKAFVDAITLAEYVLADLDERPLDEAYLRSIGFCEYKDITGMAIETLPGMYLSWTVKDGFELNGSYWLCETRGQLRRLLSALGVEVRE